MAYENLPISPLSLPSSFNFATHIVDYWSSKTPSQLALVWTNQSLSANRKLTYTHFSRQSHRIAQLLTSLGVRQGDICILILPRLPEWWEIAIACLRAGIVLCPCTTLLVVKDIEYRLQVSRATCFIGDSVAVEKLQNVRDRCPDLKTVVQINDPTTSSTVPTSPHNDTASVVRSKPKTPHNVVPYYTALSSIPENTIFPTPSSLTPTSPALIFFTSGTTGPPKMVQHSQTSYPLAHALTGVHWLLLKPPSSNTKQSLYWNLSEQGWAKASWSFFATFSTGAALFVHDDRLPFSATRTIQVLHKFPITTLCAPPTVYRQLVLDENRKLLQSPQGKPKALTHACGAGEPLNESVISTWKEITGKEIWDGYGQTETILLVANQADKGVKRGSMGRPIPGVPVKVIDEEGQEMKEEGKEGDIAVEISDDNSNKNKKENEKEFFGIFQGYIDMKTGKLDRRIKEFNQNGNKKKYYLTGDRATRDKDGYFWFVGRSDDVINSSGYRIGPFEVESTLKQHPAIVESAVVASPDPQRDEVVKAFIVLTSEAASKLKSDSNESTTKFIKELQDFCKKNAAPYKYPRKIEFVGASFLPKTISGKIKRAELKKLERERYEKEKRKQGPKL